MKITYIFDLDETLVYSVWKKDKYVTYLRPYTRQLLRYFYVNQDKFNIGFWSTGLDVYVEEVMKKLLKSYKDYPVKLLLARTKKMIDVINKDDKFKNEIPFIIDMQSGKTYYYTYYKNNISKKMDLLKHRDFKDRFDKEIILVDDLESNIMVNKLKHVYAISSWKNTKKDVELKILLDCIKKKKKCTRKKINVE